MLYKDVLSEQCHSEFCQANKSQDDCEGVGVLIDASMASTMVTTESHGEHNKMPLEGSNGRATTTYYLLAHVYRIRVSFD